MGCFNTVCNISGATIHADESVKVFITLPNSYFNISLTLHYDNSLQMPISLPITGTYDDYGCVKPDDTYTNSLIGPIFDRLLDEKKITLSDRAYNDGTKDPSYRWLKFISQGAVLWMDNPHRSGKAKEDLKRENTLTLAFTLPQAWKAAISCIQKDKEEYFSFWSARKRCQEFDLWWAWFKPLVAKFEYDDEDLLYMCRFGNGTSAFMKHEKDKKTEYDRSKPESQHEHGNQFLYWTNWEGQLQLLGWMERYLPYFFKASEGEFVALKNAFVDSWIARDAMSYLDKHWMPFISGKQCFDEDIEKAKINFLKSQQAFLEKRLTKWSEENG